MTSCLIKTIRFPRESYSIIPFVKTRPTDQVRIRRVNSRQIRATPGRKSVSDSSEPSGWIYQDRSITDDDLVGFAAFVYIITRISTGRRYVGKKSITRRITRKPLKGKTRKRHSTAKSDYETYWGSSDELKADIAEHGYEDFTREVVHLCRTRAESSYHEARIQMIEDVLLKPDEWYNSAIQVRVHRNHLIKKKKL